MPPLPDSVVAVVWLASTALLGTAAWTLAGRLFPQGSVSNRVAHTVVIGWAHIVAVSTALGAVGGLVPAALLAGVSGAAALSLCLARRLSPPGDLVRSAPSATEPFWPYLWAALAALWVGHAVTGGLLRFPNDWDTLMYHLPLVDHWLQAGSLYAPDGLRWSDPGNNELLALWLVAPFSGDFLYALGNLPAVVLLACGTVELGRQIGLSGTWRNLAALVNVTNFVALKQLVDAENDVAVAACFVAFLAYAMRYSGDRRGADLGLGAVALGLMTGIKFYALGYAGTGGVIAGALIWHRHGARAAARAAATGALGCVVFAGYWYARNGIAGGSPLYPFGAPADGAGLLGVYPEVWRTTFIGNGSPLLLPLALRAVWRMAGPCPLFALLCAPVAALWLFVGARPARGGGQTGPRACRVALAVALLAAAGVWSVTPFTVEDVPGTLNQMHWQYCPARYGMCFLCLVVLASAALLQDLVTALGGRLRAADRGRLVLPLVAGAAALLQARVFLDARLPIELEGSLLVGANAALLAVHLHRANAFQRRGRALAAVGVFCGGFALGCDRLATRWHEGFDEYYDRILGRGALRHLASSQRPGTARCVLDHRAYPHFGSARQFRVCQPRVIPSYTWWEDYVRENRIELLVARYDMGSHNNNGWLATRVWVTERPDVFVPLSDGRRGHFAYEVRPRPLARNGSPHNSSGLEAGARAGAREGANHTGEPPGRGRARYTALIHTSSDSGHW